MGGASVIKLTCRLRQSLVLPLRLHSLSIVFRPSRLGATLNLLFHGCLRSSHHPFKLPCIMTVSNVNGRCAIVSGIIHISAVDRLNVSIVAAHFKV